MGLLLALRMLADPLRSLMYFYEPLGRSERRMKWDPEPVSSTASNRFVQRSDNPRSA